MATVLAVLTSAGYEPDNCRWATPVLKRQNQRRMNHGHFA